jgi:hypothetical protein
MHWATTRFRISTPRVRRTGPSPRSGCVGILHGVRDLAFVRELNPELQTLDSWLTEHKNEIPLD